MTPEDRNNLRYILSRRDLLVSQGEWRRLARAALDEIEGRSAPTVFVSGNITTVTKTVPK